MPLISNETLMDQLKDAQAWQAIKNNDFELARELIEHGEQNK